MKDSDSGWKTRRDMDRGEETGNKERQGDGERQLKDSWRQQQTTTITARQCATIQDKERQREIKRGNGRKREAMGDSVRQ